MGKPQVEMGGSTLSQIQWSRPSQARPEKFQSILREHGVTATLRREKGHDIAAACGQLRLQTMELRNERLRR
jgi:23S rRNA (adenine2503-C2)-methyltransferase